MGILCLNTFIWIFIQTSKWRNGQTPWPIVNACMNQLNATGFMSNRGRQIVASALINELGIDWRAGAGYFQQQLIDHDVYSNTGNWQYIAGLLGTDKKKHFDIDDQTSRYDPAGDFVRKWTHGTTQKQLDSNDASDWPIE